MKGESKPISKWRPGWEAGCYILLKYSNRRMYDCQLRHYCKDRDVMKRIKEGLDVRVYMNVGDKDVTRESLFGVLGRLEMLVPPEKVQLSVGALHAHIAAIALDDEKPAVAACV